MMKYKEYNRPNSYGKEGEDHVNISLQSDLPIGQFLDPSYSYQFTTDIGGRFKSVLNIIYFLRSEPLDDSIRFMSRKNLRLFVRNSKLRRMNNHLLVLLYYSYKKVMSNEIMVSNIKGLPDNVEVLSYRTDKRSKLRIANGNAGIIVPVMKEIISAVKESREPNFESFVEVGVVEDRFTPPEIKAIIDRVF